jgi:hypothetical protein
MPGDSAMKWFSIFRRLRCERSTLKDEAGFAVPTVMLLLVASLGLVTVGVVASVRAQQGTARDQGSKAALAASESGISEALQRYNRIATTPTQPCLAVAGEVIVLDVLETTGSGAGWCEPVEGSTESGTYTYWVRPQAGQLEIVSTGSANGATRRTDVEAVTSSGQAVFATGTALAQAGITMTSNSSIYGNIASNGDISLADDAILSGNASHGVGRQMTVTGNAQHLAGTVTEAQTSIPSVNPGDSAIVNDNERLTTGEDPVYGNPAQVSWDENTRVLEMTGNASVALGGTVYSLCGLSLSGNASVYLANEADTTIYFDSPEACGLASGASQLETSGNSVITANAGAGELAMLFVGSSALASQITLSSNTQANDDCEQSYVVYAPLTNVDFDTNARYCGALAANTITMGSEARIETPAGVDEYVLPNVAAHYEPNQFIECAASASGAPDSGC